MKITKQLKEKAFNYGQEAFLNGIKTPALDKEFLNDMIAGRKVGNGSVILMKEWLRGWTTENLKIR